MRTICSEPIDCSVGCKVFRPAIIRSLARNPDVGFVKEGFRIDGSPLTVTNQTEFRNLEKLFGAEGFDMPVVLVADSGYNETKEERKAGTDISSAFSNLNSMNGLGLHGSSFIGDISGNAERSGFTVPDLAFSDKAQDSISLNPSVSVIVSRKAVKPSPAAHGNNKKKTPVKKEKLLVFDYNALAAMQTGFSVVCFVNENCFALVRNKLGIAL